MNEVLDFLTSHRVGFVLARVILAALGGLGFASVGAALGSQWLQYLALGGCFSVGAWLGWKWLGDVADVRREE